MFTPKFEKLNLNAVMTSTIEIIKSHAESNHITIDLKLLANDQLVVLIDKLRVQQILINLIQNSIQVSQFGGKVVVSLDQFVVTDPKKEIGVNIRVTD